MKRTSEVIKEELESTQKSRDAMVEKKLPKSGIDFAEKKIKKLQDELQKVLSEENAGPTEEELEAQRKEEETKAENERKEKEAKEAQEAAEKEKAKRKPKNGVKITNDNLKECREAIEAQGLRITKISERQKSEKPKTQRKVSTVLADNIIRAISGAVSHELNLDAVLGINVQKIEDALKHFEKGLMAMRAGLGGIEDDNSQMINTFRKNGKELIQLILDRQKQAEEKKAA
jgi:hypothetical protein